MSKRQSRTRRGKKTKAIQQGPRIVVFRSGKNIYAQLVVRETQGDKVLAVSSTLDKSLSKKIENKTKIEQAFMVGKLLGERVKDDTQKVSFDRSGYKYHGRVKALAEGAREAGLKF